MGSDPNIRRHALCLIDLWFAETEPTQEQLDHLCLLILQTGADLLATHREPKPKPVLVPISPLGTNINYVAPERIPIPPSVRWEVWERDGFTCQYCGARRDLSIDHIIPVVKGGSNGIANLTTACQACNKRKKDRDLDVFLAEMRGAYPPS